MHFIHAIILGIVQGLTEFLPVSSSAHLLLMREVLGWGLLGDEHWNTIFDVSAHAGTFVALLLYFRTDLWRLVQGFFTTFRGCAGRSQEGRLAWIILVATIPGGLAGWLGEDAIEGVFRLQPMLMAGLLVVFGVVLWLADRGGRKARELSGAGWLDGILIGCAQALALAPGVSRSGITITTGLMRGMTRETAARFSFLLSTPIIGGAALYGLKDVVENTASLPSGAISMFLIGFAAAAVSGYLCIRYFLHYLQSRSLTPFVVYRVVLGVGLLAWFGARL